MAHRSGLQYFPGGAPRQPIGWWIQRNPSLEGIEDVSIQTGRKRRFVPCPIRPRAWQLCRSRHVPGMQMTAR